MRLRRSELSTPGSNEKMIAKAARSAADLVFLDLEDSVAPNEKAAARANVVSALSELDWGGRTTAVRVNALDTPYALDDITTVVEQAGSALDLIIVPKIRSPRDVWFVDTLLEQLERRQPRERPVGLEVLIEDVEALVCVEDIARATPRLEALIFGQGDFAASQGVSTSAIGGGADDLYPGDVWHHARNRIVVAAKAAGIEAVDGPFAAFRDQDGYTRECRRAATLGFSGKWAIHPAQIDIANTCFSPTPADVARARRLMAAFADAEAAGAGSVAIDGEMVDAASVRLLRNITDKADRIGM